MSLLSICIQSIGASFEVGISIYVRRAAVEAMNGIEEVFANRRNQGKTID
jgi:hypothetical protein